MISSDNDTRALPSDRDRLLLIFERRSEDRDRLISNAEEWLEEQG